MQVVRHFLEHPQQHLLVVVQQLDKLMQFIILDLILHNITLATKQVVQQLIKALLELVFKHQVQQDLIESQLYVIKLLHKHCGEEEAELVIKPLHKHYGEDALELVIKHQVQQDIIELQLYVIKHQVKHYGDEEVVLAM
jgi:hypothetical protein